MIADVWVVDAQFERGVVLRDVALDDAPPYAVAESVAHRVGCGKVYAVQHGTRTSDGRICACFIAVDAAQLPALAAHAQQAVAAFRAFHEARMAVYGHLSTQLLPWFAEHARAMPWRGTKDPYRVWLSEVMLQQTRVDTVRGYFDRFVATFPTVHDLAAADIDTVLKMWEGLGYYRRARSLHAAAQHVVEVYGGVFPNTFAALRTLPGVGAYTAGAIASICFDRPTPAIDGNVARVLARLTEDLRPIDDAETMRSMTQALAAVYPEGHCGDFSQALIELGATVCVPNGAPQCDRCPLSTHCLAHRRQTFTVLPVKKPKRAKTVQPMTYFLYRSGEQVALERRTEQGVLHGLWQLPSIARAMTEAEALAEARTLSPTARLVETVRGKHLFTHITWEITCYVIALDAPCAPYFWATRHDLDTEISVPTAFRKFL